MALALLTAPSAAAQATGAVAGHVTDAETGDPLVGANVAIESLQRGAAASADGVFVIEDVPAGAYDLTVRFVGYAPAEQRVRVAAGETARVEVALTPSTARLDGIDVTALRPDLQPESSLGASRIRELSAADPGQLLRALPGLGAVRRGALGLDPNVRGLSETEVGTYIDGQRTFPAGPLRMDTPLSHTDPTAIQRVEVVKGPYALTWGAGNMSAIRVTTQAENPPPESFAGSHVMGYGTNQQAFETAATLAGTPGRVSYSAHIAARDGGDYRAGNGETIPARYTSGEGRARVGYEVAPGAEAYARGSYQEQQDIDYPGRLLNADFFRTGTGALGYTMQRGTGLVRGVEARASFQQTLHRMTNEGKPTFEAGTFPNGNPRPPLRIFVNAELANADGRLAVDLAPTERLALKVGGDVYSAFRNAQRPFRVVTPNGEMTPPFYDSDEVWPGVRITDAGLFANAERVFGAVTASGTVRLDLVRATADEGRVSQAFLDNAGVARDDLDQSEANLSGAVTASVPLAERWTAAAGVGTVVRTADALERYADRFPASKAQTSAEFVGDPGLDPERSTQADLWLEAAYPRLSLQLSGFARRLSNYITLEPTDVAPLLPLSPPTVFRYVNGEATFYGVEARVAVAPVDALTLRLGASYLWGRDDTLDEPALGVMPPSAEVGVRVEPLRSGALRSARFAKTLFLEAALHLVAEQDRVATTRGETPTDGYATADLRLGYSPFGRVTLRAGVENITDVQYVNHLNAKNPFTATPLPEPGRTFSLGLRAEW